jgi:hypothetical protein
VITYVPINLTNKKFYVGSTNDFNRRWRSHLNSTDNYPFQNSLRNDPENFFVLISEDDGLDTRDEEQYYLDFYHGTAWCYNLRPSAESGGDTCSNTVWWNNGIRNQRSAVCPGEGWQPGKLGKTAGNWWNDGVTTVRSHECPGEGWVRGSLHRRGKYPRGEDHPSYGNRRPGMLWWNNGESCVRSPNCPGEGWARGVLPGSRPGPKNPLFGKNNPRSKPVYLVRPDGFEEYHDSIASACKEHNLLQQHLGKVAKGERKHHKGFIARFA